MKILPFQGIRSLGWLPVAAALGLAIGVGGLVNSAPRTSVQPYLQIQQVLTADFNGGDVLTYTGVGGGVNAQVETRRVTATVSYDYQRRLSWDGDLDDHDVHSGLAAVHVEAIPGVLGFDAGALATRSNADPRFPVAGLRTVDSPGAAEVYSVYAGPTLNTHAGSLQIGAAYRLGYVFVDDHSLSEDFLPVGAPRVDRYSSSTVHNATASVGMGTGGSLPFGWTVGGGYVREDMNRLDSTFEGAYIRGDVVVPVSPTLALTAGLGYEDLHASQQDILRTAGSVPVVGPDGRVLGDPSAPRLVTYDESGLIWDAGVLWRPTPRTEAQARFGRRYGGTSVTGSLSHRFHRGYSVSASVYDTVSSFGRLLVADLAGVPRSFDPRRNGINVGQNGVPLCVYGTDPGTGACFDDALQSIDNFNFRNRGASLGVSAVRGPWSFGGGAGYNSRRYYAPPGPDFVLHGVTDHSFSLSGQAGRRLSRSSGFDIGAYAAWYDSGLFGTPSSFSTGVTGSYYQRLFHDRLQANLSAGLYTSQAGDFDSTVGALSLGLRYSF